jgi:hypothetical protein
MQINWFNEGIGMDYHHSDFEQEQERNPREAFIDKRVGQLCNNGMDYSQAVTVAEKQADHSFKYRGFYPD